MKLVKIIPTADSISYIRCVSSDFIGYTVPFFDCSHKHVELETTQTTNDHLASIIEGILSYHRNALFSSWQALEWQQDQVNETTNLEVYIELERANWILHNSWLQFRR